MSRFEMEVFKPGAIQFELRATLTLDEWLTIKVALKDAPAYGPTGQLVDAIRAMTADAQKTFRHYPQAEGENREPQPS